MTDFLHQIFTKNWNSKLIDFVQKYHNYKTPLSQEENKDAPKDVLFIVNPVSGAGRSQRLFPEALDEFEKRGRIVDVYCTAGSNDMLSLTKSKDISKYKLIAFLSGDSTMMEFVQPELRKNDGKWTHAPILHLPGGSSNVIASDCFGAQKTVRDIISMASKVKKGSVVKCSTHGAEPYYALHTACCGFQSYLIEQMESMRHGIYTILGPFAIIPFLLISFISYHFQPKVPHMCTIMASDVEAQGLVDLNFGVSRFEKSPKMITLYMKKYKGIWSNVLGIYKFFSGELGKQYKKGKLINKDAQFQVTKKWTVKGDGPYKIYFDGSSSISLVGDEITFEVLPECVPYYTKESR